MRRRPRPPGGARACWALSRGGPTWCDCSPCSTTSTRTCRHRSTCRSGRSRPRSTSTCWCRRSLGCVRPRRGLAAGLPALALGGLVDPAPMSAATWPPASCPAASTSSSWAPAVGVLYLDARAGGAVAGSVDCSAARAPSRPCWSPSSPSAPTTARPSSPARRGPALPRAPGRRPGHRRAAGADHVRRPCPACEHPLPALWLGGISFSLYLWHYPILDRGLAQLDRRLPTGLVGLIALAWCWWPSPPRWRSTDWWSCPAAPVVAAGRGVALPVLEPELRLEDLQEVAVARRSRSRAEESAAVQTIPSPSCSSPRFWPSTLNVAGRWPWTTSRTPAVGSSTSVRSKSMWGETGVSSRARWVGATIGPAGRERVGRRPGGGGDDQAVGGVGGEELAVDLDGEAHRVAHRRLLEHRLVEGEVRPSAAPSARSTRDREQHPLLDAVLAGEEPLEGVAVLGGSTSVR